ncbi:MAG: radical SAM protein [Candidatus Pacearchaeota archaeon]
MQDKIIDTVYWEIAPSCNLRCKHCYIGDLKARPFEKEEAIEIVDNLNNEGVKILLLLGREPILYPHLYDVIKKARSYDMNTAVLTNGTLVNEEIAKKMKDSDVSAVQVSLDGNEKTHDLMRGEGNYKRAIRGINILRNNGVNTFVKLTLTKETISSLEDLVNLCKTENLKFGVSPLMLTGYGKERSTPVSPEEYFEICVRLFNLKKQGMEVCMPDRAIEEFLEYGYPKSGCSAGWRMASVTLDRKVVPCPYLSSIENFKSFEKPNFNKSITSSYNSPLFSFFREETKESFECPIRKDLLGKDIFSVYEFAKWYNETLQKSNNL